jgi:NADH-quinone oxidoreductase subunit G
MCTVEVEKAPKLMVACGTPATPGMVVNTKSEKVLKSRKGVLEFLLINHPLDCPVCDQSGECDLQDNDYEYGPGGSRFLEDKRVFKEATTKKLSEEITLNMNRCIHCERCVRFTEDVTKTNELLMLNRGWKKELTTAGELGMHNSYQGCLADICPVGALTFSDFRFKKRVWFLEKKPSVCDRCSKGCNISVESEHGVVFRYKPRFNKEVNTHWMCDEGRKSYNDFMSKSRVVTPLLRSKGDDKDLVSTNWSTLYEELASFFESKGKLIVVIGTDSTSEEANSLLSEIKELNQGETEFRFHNGSEGVKTSSDDASLDDLLRRKDKTSNAKGLEALAIKPFDFSKDKGFDRAVIFMNGRSVPFESSIAKSQVFWGVWDREVLKSQKNSIHSVIPGLSTLEKQGTFINCDGIEQKFDSAIKPVGHSRGVSEILNSLKEFKTSGKTENPHQVVGKWGGV